MDISILTKREIKAHDTLIELAGYLERLSPSSVNKIFHRWRMLHMVTEKEEPTFRQWLQRVNDDSGADRREQ